MLLDISDPTIVLAKLERPLLPPVANGGYVPNVVFSCGSIIYGDRLFIPYGIGDARVSVASTKVEELISEMVPQVQRIGRPSSHPQPAQNESAAGNRTATGSRS